MTAWVVFLVAGGLSLCLRAVPLLGAAAISLGPRMQGGLRHAGMGAMTALLVAALLPRDAGPLPEPAVLVAIGVAAVLAWRGSSMLRVVAGGAAGYLAVALVGLVA